MQPTNSEEFTDPLVQPDVTVYMPGTPTISFIEYVELLTSLLRR
ncbi:hypothetical protein [Natrinema sp. 1APR25-10V2]|nr:hypothetical protein [Natrinema sp. 1APR25-10V2]